MAYQYAKIEDCLDIVDVLLEGKSNQELLRTSLYGNLLEASRQFERETSAYEDFYAPFSGETDKIFRLKRGTHLLIVPPFDAIITVKDNDDEEFDDEYYDTVKDVFGNYAIKIGGGLSCTSPRFTWFGRFTITATWGWKCVPADVQLAVKAKGVLNFLLNPVNRKGLNIKLTDEQTGRLRGDYNRITRQWAARNRTLYGGIGIG